MSDKISGTVKWFNSEKGYGFIKPDDGDDVFVHINALRNSGIDGLADGQKVSFEAVQGKKGLQAENISLD